MPVELANRLGHPLVPEYQVWLDHTRAEDASHHCQVVDPVAAGEPKSEDSRCEPFYRGESVMLVTAL